MTSLNFACKFCDKEHHWQGSGIFSNVVEHALLLSFFGHILTHHLRETPHPAKAFYGFFRELFLILLHFVLTILSILSLILLPLYWVLSLLFE